MELRWKYDAEVDAGYLEMRDLRPGETLAYGLELSSNRDGTTDIVVNMDSEGRVVDIEFLGVRRLLPPAFSASPLTGSADMP